MHLKSIAVIFYHLKGNNRNDMLEFQSFNSLIEFAAIVCYLCNLVDGMCTQTSYKLDFRMSFTRKLEAVLK